MVNIERPQITLVIKAKESVKIRKGTMNTDEKTNLAKKVDIVEIQISLVFPFADSSEIWIPKASEKESAIAIVKMPPMIKSLEPVKECNPTINPNVVMIPDVKPKDNPFIIELSIFIYEKLKKIKPISRSSQTIPCFFSPFVQVLEILFALVPYPIFVPA